MQPAPRHRWTSVIRLAIVLYCLAGLMQIRQKPGLQHDEAFLVLGAVHMRHLPHEELTLPHDPDTWVEAFGVWFPLMTARYVGSIKEFLCLPVFAAFGTRTALVRILSMLLGAIGIWGIAGLVRAQLDARVAAIAALTLAISPSYVANTVFDNGTVSIFMAALGLMSVAIARYLRRGGVLAAFAIGFTVGFGTWARVNFIWLAAALLAGVVLTLRGRLLRIPRSHWLAALCGGLLGGLPLIAYQIVSHGGTWQAVGMFSTHEPLLHRLSARLVMFSEALLSDREHRAMWDGPSMIWWQRWLFLCVVAGSCLAGLVQQNRDPNRTLWARILSLSFLLFATTLFFSSLPVAEHHLVELLPLAAVIVVLAGFTLAERLPRARCPLVAVYLVYLCCVFQWQAAGLAGLKRTGGVGPWSDGLIPLAEHLERYYSGSEIKLLDWGLQDNLYVVTDGRVRSRDIYSGATRERSGLNRPWLNELSAGGVFVYFAAHRQMPEATNAFLDALREGSPLTRRFSVAQRDGAPYAEMVEVDADTLHLGGGSSIATGDPRFAGRLDGFHQIETGGWRWSKRNFAVTLDSPRLAGASAARLTLRVYLPESLIQQLGPVTLAARIGDHALPPETYRQPGVFTFSRDLRPEWLQAGPNRIEFALDRAIAPRQGDKRELGIIVQAAALDAMR